MKYEILTCTYKPDLESLVETYLKAGWNLQGSPSWCVGDAGEACFFMQAVTKEGE